MQLTKHTDYAFRILLFLLALPEDQKTTIGKIVETYDISKSHVMKIVNKLASEGLIVSSRGKSGGICISSKGLEASVGDIIRLMETSVQAIDCSSSDCVLNTHCKLTMHLREASEAFIARLDAVKIKDLQAKEMVEVLKLV